MIIILLLLLLLVSVVIIFSLTGGSKNITAHSPIQNRTNDSVSTKFIHVDEFKSILIRSADAMDDASTKKTIEGTCTSVGGNIVQFLVKPNPSVSDQILAKTLSHFYTIVQSATDEVNVILEDGKYQIDIDRITSIVRDAPSDWGIIQLLTNRHMHEFVQWSNSYKGINAYLIKRECAEYIKQVIYRDDIIMIDRTNVFSPMCADSFIYTIANQKTPFTVYTLV